ncbi:MAG: radical SAM protein [Candidatus Aenigmarchaeota archaeon]|nr:radical SAM protein [Candidatus Aenigmarchaeota archaeon]
MKTVKGTPKHLSKIGKLNKFTYLMLNLPFSCNYCCKKCFSRNLNKKHSAQDDIGLKKRLSLIKEANKLGAKVIVVAGKGEPSINKETKKIVAKANTLGMISIIYDNGSVLSKKLLEFYRDNNAVLVISLDSLNPNVYDWLTQTKGNLPKVLKNIENAVDIYRNTIKTVNGMRILSIAVNTTVSDINEKEIATIKNYLKKRFGNDVYFICNPLAKYGSGMKNWKTMIDDKKHARQIALIKKFSETGGPLMRGSDGICGYSTWGIGIDPNGDYMTCAYTVATNGLLGNVRNTNIAEAFDRKHSIESKYHNKKQPCLIRSPRFKEYLKELKTTSGR